MRKMFKSAVCMVLIAVMLSSGALAAYSAKVLYPTMKVYNSGKQVVDTLKQGKSIKVTDISGDWAKISYNGNTGYAKMKDIIFNKRIKAVSTKATSIRFVTKKSYKEGTYYKATLAKDVTVYVVGLNGSQALIENEDGTALGYVKLSALRKI